MRAPVQAEGLPKSKQTSPCPSGMRKHLKPTPTLPRESMLSGEVFFYAHSTSFCLRPHMRGRILPLLPGAIPAAGEIILLSHMNSRAMAFPHPASAHANDAWAHAAQPHVLMQNLVRVDNVHSGGRTQLLRSAVVRLDLDTTRLERYHGALWSYGWLCVVSALYPQQPAWDNN